ncbi:hypothetical protein Nepgr_031649 [Nepenthes gracilis]|uniref:DNA-directed RNA polymerase n=1 Tax=Nepenthes gracilis TaxID=150966 RepID=A0AAD3Y7P7_NEPGR|nr:hypothetical protein Nepgr_031649 [Nepenthes gracilis]
MLSITHFGCSMEIFQLSHILFNAYVVGFGQNFLLEHQGNCTSMDNDIVNKVPAGLLTGISFSVLTEADAEKISVLSIETVSEVTDPRLGFPNPTSQCTSCGAKDTKHCEGHFGVIKFPFTILHPYYISEVAQIFNKICPGCKSIWHDLRHKGAGKLPKLGQLKGCKYCIRQSRYPPMRFKISSNDLFRRTAIVVESLGHILPDDYWDFIPKDRQQEESINRTNRRVLSHAQIRYLLKDVDPNFIKEFVSRTNSLFLSCFPVTPNCHRVTEFVHRMSNGQKLGFDDRTRAFRKLVDFRGTANELGSRVLDCMKLSKLRLEKSTSNEYALMSNTDLSLNTSSSKWMKEVVLTKRSDHIFRTVAIGDPNIKLSEIGIPCYIAEQLQVSDCLNSWNWDQLTASCNLRLLEKGEVYVRRKGDLVRVRSMDKFQEGDIIHRPLSDGDVVLINRPPSIHQHSHLALYVKVLPINSVVSINPLCCAPLRGDFDGDCLHGYISQSLDCRVELRELVALDRQLINGQSGRNLLSLAHDSLTAAHLVMSEGELLGPLQMQQLEMLCPWKSGPPAIVKSLSVKSCLWTGRQLFSMLLPPDFEYDSPPSGVLVISGQLITSPPGSLWMRSDADGSFFDNLTKHCHGEVLTCLHAAQQVLCEWLSMRGLSVSLLDLYISSDADSRKNMIDEVFCGLQEAKRLCNVKQLMVESSANYFTENSENQNAMCLEAERLCYEKQKSAALSRISVSAFKQVFRDTQNLMSQYADDDNSLLAIVKSGSKGNLLKIVQQCMCIGLQHSLVPMSFRFPHELSCAAWNNLKTDSSSLKDQDNVEYNRSYIPYAVVESSFLMGLNPLECFVHSVTNRDSSFSENADVPGTLNRRLMFFMRDLYIAYDGTVRNTYGHQLVQFSYEIRKEKSSPVNCTEASFDKGMHVHGATGGQPVGSLAACAISEAAYSALDQPVSILEASPLLNLKKVLESGLRKSNASKTVSLFLSNKLVRIRYGFEYAALEVKNHLERLLFSDIVSEVLIDYSPETSIQLHLSPWICHFHVCKETVKRRGLKTQTIIDALRKKCSSTSALHGLQICSKSCSLADADKQNKQMLCFSATAFENNGMDIIRDVVISYLLRSVIKGSLEIEKVDILWNDLPNESRSHRGSHGELYLRISASSKCRRTKLWNVIMDNCLPIMDLIDWTRSHPDDLHDMFSAYGIDAAWRYFLGNLRSAVLDVGRTVLPEHLILVADCLSMTGEFVGLSPKGMTRQKAQMSVSAPFLQACFSNPGASFIKAAKNGASDQLQGTLDALAWGKIPSLGTGTKFEFIYSGKGHELEKPVDVYSLLRSGTSSFEHNIKIKIPNGRKLLSEKCDPSECRFELPATKGFKNLGITKSLLQSKISFEDIQKLSQTVKCILNKYAINERLSEKDELKLWMALFFHPQRDEKIGTGAMAIKVGHHPKYQDTRCFILERTDGTVEDFSYHKCVLGALELIAPCRAKSYQSRCLKEV